VGAALLLCYCDYTICLLAVSKHCIGCSTTPRTPAASSSALFAFLAVAQQQCTILRVHSATTSYFAYAKSIAAEAQVIKVVLPLSLMQSVFYTTVVSQLMLNLPCMLLPRVIYVPEDYDRVCSVSSVTSSSSSFCFLEDHQKQSKPSPRKS
jgi:hypothetical protein